MNDVAFGFLCGMLASGAIACGLRAWHWHKREHPKMTKVQQFSGVTPEGNPYLFTLPAEDSLAETPKPVEYSVAAPKHIPWRIRKAELEAKHKTRRRNLEQWRDA